MKIRAGRWDQLVAMVLSMLLVFNCDGAVFEESSTRNVAARTCFKTEPLILRRWKMR